MWASARGGSIPPSRTNALHYVIHSWSFTVPRRWGRGIEEHTSELTTGVQERTADNIQAVEEGSGRVLGRAQEFLQGTQDTVTKVLCDQLESIRRPP